MKKAVCLLSGGLDSAVTLALAKKQGYSVHALTFHYGQRHSKEVKCAVRLARKLRAEKHVVMRINLRQIGGSALTGSLKMPAGRARNKIKSGGIPVTYVPARNTIFLSIALAYAESIKAEAIYMGANHIDYSGYPDCRPRYFKAFQRMANLATKCSVEGKPIKIRAPLINMTKKQIIEKAVELGIPLELTWSCYRGKKKACCVCDSCVLRKEGFRQAGLEDPLEYER